MQQTAKLFPGSTPYSPYYVAGSSIPLTRCKDGLHGHTREKQPTRRSDCAESIHHFLRALYKISFRTVSITGAPILEGKSDRKHAACMVGTTAGTPYY